MSRTIPIDLQTDLDADTSALTWCLRADSKTVPGEQIFLTLLGRPPHVGDVVTYDHVRFEVTRVEGLGVAECIAETEPADDSATT